MIELVYMSAKEQDKLFNLLNHRNGNYLGIGVYLRHADALERADFIGFQQIGILDDSGRPDYKVELVARVRAFFKKMAGRDPHYGAIGIGIRNGDFADAPKELVGYLKLAEAIQAEDNLYMLVNAASIQIARLSMLGEKRLSYEVLPEQPIVIGPEDSQWHDWSEYFGEEWQALKGTADDRTTLLLE